jgi:hypothetical protein
MPPSAELLPGTLDLLILRAVSSRRPHGYGVLLRIERISRGGRKQLREETTGCNRFVAGIATALTVTPEAV